MRTITIIGAGHAGLQLGCGLARAGHDVTIVSNRTADQIEGGRILSSQSMYSPAVDIEREFGLAFWDETCPPLTGFHAHAGTLQAGLMVEFHTRMGPGQSVDQRLKMPRWMRTFEQLGGKVEIRETDLFDLERLAASSELVLVAAGKGEISQLFERDSQRSVHEKPQRTIALTYLHGMTPRSDCGGINIHVHPGVGELIHFPALTLTGPCDIVNLEAVIGGPMDDWNDVSNPADHLEKTLQQIRSHFPWEAHRFENVRLTDELGILAGRVTPTIRKPIGTLPSGRSVLGIGDVFVLNDPATGQGSNNASRTSKILFDAIQARGREPFDASWIRSTVDAVWEATRCSASLTNTVLSRPPHALKVMTACSKHPRLAREFADGFGDPSSMTWFFDPLAAEQKIESYA